jgi:hypothetical protein
MFCGKRHLFNDGANEVAGEPVEVYEELTEELIEYIRNKKPECVRFAKSFFDGERSPKDKNFATEKKRLIAAIKAFKKHTR